MPITFSSLPLRVPQRLRTYAVLKSLVNSESGLPSAGELPGQSESAGQIVINFPCMPDVIDLARRANYKNLLPTAVVPDGYHYYDYTEPLSIPLSFSLSAYDEDYCGDYGGVMLLSIAAKLHALMLPVVPNGTTLVKTSVAAPPVDQKVAGGGSESKDKNDSQANSAATSDPLESVSQQSFTRTGQTRFAFPPACSLNIMLAQLGGSSGLTNATNDGSRSMGIVCTGFITDVRVSLKGPWLQGSFKTDGLRNLPASAEFSFTFVHQPGYTNNVLGGGAAIVTTSAMDIFQRLYNTADITGNGGQLLYAGIDGNGLLPASVPVAGG